MGKDATEYDLKSHEVYKDVRVLVTGASGFLGGALVKRLVDYGAMVWCTWRDMCPTERFAASRIWKFGIEDMIFGDLRDNLTMERAIGESFPDIIFHCAAMTQVGQSRLMPLQSYQTNVMGTVNVLDNVRQMRSATPIVVSSSDKAYGHPLEIPISQETPFNPIHPYDASKAAMDLIAKSYGKYYDMNIGILRCGNIYGPGDTNWKRLVPGILRDIIRSQAPIIRSDGKQIRDYNYISDIVNAYLLLGWKMLLMRLNGEGYIVSANEHHSVIEMVEKMRSTLSKIKPRYRIQLEPVILNEAQDETKEIILDGSKFREDFKWEPEVSLDLGLQRTAIWLIDYLRRD